MAVSFKELGVRPYDSTLAAMRQFTDRRDAATPDEIWALEHPPVYTLGLAGRLQHLHAAGNIPVIKSDRGGQVTFHGPGQLIVYTLLDVRRLALTPRTLVHRLEQAVIDLLLELGLKGSRRPGAPGVYVDGAKIAALGIRIRRGCSYHGLALNVDLDLAPFANIDPCGYPGLQVTRLADFGVTVDCREAGALLRPHLLNCLGLQDQTLPRHADRPGSKRLPVQWPETARGR